MGYNQHHITSIGFRFEMNSYSTQVAPLQFEYIYIYELCKTSLEESRYRSKRCLDDI
jgi:hypothetical protein